MLSQSTLNTRAAGFPDLTSTLSVDLLPGCHATPPSQKSYTAWQLRQMWSGGAFSMKPKASGWCRFVRVVPVHGRNGKPHWPGNQRARSIKPASKKYGIQDASQTEGCRLQLHLPLSKTLTVHCAEILGTFKAKVGSAISTAPVSSLWQG